jgi:ABC-type sugar transport system ATPase subunit
MTGPEESETARLEPASGGAGLSPAPQEPAPLLSLLGMHKRFGGVHALRGADLVVRRRGVVQALMGENGSGKSTLLSILCGVLARDSGQLRLDGETLELHGPADALAHGIVMVSQETHVALDLSVAENVLLGRRLVRSRTGINWRATRRRAADVLARLELDYNPDWQLRQLRPDQRQMVEIARALSFGAKILVLDEPTSSLTDDEVRSLFRAIDRLRAHDVSVLFVSHRLDEVLEISDEITVLRDGRTVAHRRTSDFDAGSLVHAMVGDVQTEVPERSSGRAGHATVPVLRVTDLADGRALTDVTLETYAGEIVGVSGLVGSGCSELLEALFGLRSTTAGTIEISGRRVSARDPRSLIVQGVGYLPPDRKTDALVGSMSVRDNLTMVATIDRAWFRRPHGAADAEVVDRAARAVSLRVSSRLALVSTLSGGNQQKVAIGKWLSREPVLLLLDEPTRGVDVAAKAEIHQRIRQASDRGACVLVSSSDNRELLDLCDRIVVLFRGRVRGSLWRDEADETRLAAMGGGQT